MQHSLKKPTKRITTTDKASRRLLWVIAACCVLVISGINTGAHAATLSLIARNNPVSLDPITAQEILNQAGATERTISLGSPTGNVGIDWTVGDITITPPGLITTRFNRIYQNVWALRFDNGELAGPITVDVNYTIIDNNGMTGFLNNAFVPTSRIAVTTTLLLNERFWANGRLRRVRGGADFALDIKQATSSGSHSGTLVIEVTFM